VVVPGFNPKRLGRNPMANGSSVGGVRLLRLCRMPWNRIPVLLRRSLLGFVETNPGWRKNGGVKNFRALHGEKHGVLSNRAATILLEKAEKERNRNNLAPKREHQNGRVSHAQLRPIRAS